jgi:hypothetical protein
MVLFNKKRTRRMRTKTTAKILSETSEDTKQIVRDTANKLIMKTETSEEETKCYCGHTTTCDCGPEEPKQTTESIDN